ncbi:hypothetical protein K2X40_02470 [Candidatus Babeliales bacterium]|nr:hypothetical protein [Candidatus Babeliales bacterium]
MKKILLSSILVLGLGMQSAVCNATTQSALNVQKDFEMLIAYAQQNNLSAEQTLKLAQESIDQAAHFDDFNVEVKQDNKQKMLIIAGVVVVVVVVAGVAYYYYNKNKKITTAREVAEEILKNLDSIDSVEGFMKEMEALQKRSELSDEEAAHLARATDQFSQEFVGAVMRRGSFRTKIEAKEFVNRYFKENFVKAVDESYKEGFTAAERAEIKKAAERERAK